jgi:serine/threonine protein kinase
MEQTQVSTGLGVREFLDGLQACGLLSAEEFERATQVAADAKANGLALAELLVAAGFLTQYQAEAVYKQKQAELRIGNYDVLDHLGAGGMGTVFKARHRRMKRIVAIKVLSRGLAKDESFVQRFQREVETIARFTHPNIVMAYDADEAEAGHFLVMEFVDGQDLASMVQKQGPLSVPAAVNCLLQAARGLEYAHSQGLIHRDVKPANLLCDAAGTVKITDLGLARFASAGGSEAAGSITKAGSILGTVDYMPPEQAIDATEIDHRADIYSLGATLHFLLLNRPPYQGESLVAIMFKHKLDPIPSLKALRPDVPDALEETYFRMMAKDPAERIQTMAEVVHALEGVAANLPETITIAPLKPSRSDETFIARPSSPFDQSLDTSLVTTAADKTTCSPPPASAGLRSAVSLKVLLVEPSRTQSGIIRKYLQSQGVQEIVAAASGHEALQAFRTERPDAIVSALHLSDMTGVELARQVREEAKAAAPGFVLISSESESSDAGSLSKCGDAVLVKKPFTPEQLLGALRVVTRRSQSAPSAVDRGNLRVLIVDDSASARLHVRTVLSVMGVANFAEAADGAQAVAAVARETFDLIVTDYNMPLMDGRGLVGYLRQNPATASVPIIMVTTETDPAKLEAVRRLGVTAVCDKSFPPEIVRTIIDELAVAAEVS